MIATTTETFLVLALGCLALNLYAFRSAVAQSGHGRSRLVQFAAIWGSLILGLTIILHYLT